MVDIGCPGRHSDGGVLSSSVFGRKLQSGELGFPGATNLPRLYRRVLGVSPEVAECVVKATCILHNFLRWDYDGEDVPRTTIVPTESQGAVQRIPRVGSNNASREAAAVRETFTSYFSSPDSRVPWQDSIL
ncbi:hypothetical protein SKAU_G00325750 [Synaphobranchus kaupii]|uniref:DDE Tnp4 domain-containing protein n=1 Tax=Synaphobranchus kaupii TaxID=118154 RepID=A0A9Q1IK05_SYNKA|nr:hypothetical protein SKAU_G00325750 [Synaphobranchus kaupii]